MIPMADSATVKKYLAYWFQLGKKIVIPSLNTALLPTQIFNGYDYASEFESCWDFVINHPKGDCYLEGTSQTIQELLSSQWEIVDCARCNMPVPMIDLGVQSSCCLCSDMDNWPNNELPPPRHPVNNNFRLKQICDSLKNKNNP